MPGTQTSEWQKLTESVSSGSLRLDPDAALRCAHHCTDFIDTLRQIRMDAVQLRDVNGFGTFASGMALATKFSKKAVGADVYSMVQALEDHIATVTEMRDVFTRIHSMYATTEQDNTEALTAADGGG